MFTIETKFGNDGYAFWFKLLEQLAGAEHHYLDCNDIGTWEYLLAKSKFESKTANDILDICSNLGAINQNLWNHRIIRSDTLLANLGSLYNRRGVAPLGNDEVLLLCKQKSDSTTVSVSKNPQRETKEKNEDIIMKTKVNRSEQKREERIPKGNPKSSEKPADISDVSEVSNFKTELLLEEEYISVAADLDQVFEDTMRGELRTVTSPIKEAEAKNCVTPNGVIDEGFIEFGNEEVKPKHESITDTYGWNEMLGNESQSESMVIEPTRLEDNEQLNVKNEAEKNLLENIQTPPRQSQKSALIEDGSEW